MLNPGLLTGISVSYRARALRAAAACFVFCGLSALQVSADQIDDSGPAGSGVYGEFVLVLENGNTVVGDPYWDGTAGNDVGAVRLYDKYGGLISIMTGANAGDRFGINGFLELPDGYAILSPYANGDRGAVTVCDSATGCSGVPDRFNSKVGRCPGDQAGYRETRVWPGRSAIVISSRYQGACGGLAEADDGMDGGVGDVGAVTFCSGTEPCIGEVSEQNSLIGTSTGDDVGSGGITLLPDGSYVVNSPTWNNPSGTANVGAVTWCNGITGCTGTVTAANSLTGSRPNDTVGGTGVTALSDGGYVVASTDWDNPSPLTVDVGASTYCSAAAPCTGPVTASNSLIGSTPGDFVGPVTALTGGNYVAHTPLWDNPSGMLQDVGAVRFCSAATPCTGTITASNSLVGTSDFDSVGNGGMAALTTGNYVVVSPGWNNTSPELEDAGAATFCTAAAPCTGPITSTNSLVGDRDFDNVGIGTVTPLTNGNYVVASQFWSNPALGGNNNAGAATWGNGTTGTVGSITSTNSLVGGGSSSGVGGGGVTALTNGNYVVRSPNWSNPSPAVSAVGAVTWADGNGTTTGIVTATNSLIGGRSFDNAGNAGVTALTNGNYVVASTNWDNPSPVIANVGAVTWGNGTGGTVGPITVSNSLIGGTANDSVGNGAIGGAGPVTALPGGNYAVTSTNWDNPSPAIVNATAVSFGNGAGGTTGLVSSANSVMGTVADGTNTFSYDQLRNRLFVGRAASNIVSILFFNSTAITDGDFSSAATWDNGVPNGNVNGVIPDGRTVTLTSPTTVGLVSVGCTGAIAGASSTAYIVGSVEKDVCPAPRNAGSVTFHYPVGDGTNYSPMAASNIGGTGSLLVHVIDTTLPGLNPAQSASRFWRLSGSGITTDLSFTYVDADINGTEANYKVFKLSDGVATQVTPFSLNTGTNTITATGVSSFSDWGVGNVAPPTAANVSVAGRVFTDDGRGLGNAVVTITGPTGLTQRAITSSFGYYRFEDVAAGQAYVIGVSSKRYQFTPRVVTVVDELTNVDFIAETLGKRSER